MIKNQKDRKPGVTFMMGIIQLLKAKAALMELGDEYSPAAKLIIMFRDNEILDRTKKLWKWCMDSLQGRI